MGYKTPNLLPLACGWTGFNPVDSATYYMGTPNTTGTTGALGKKIYIPATGILTSIDLTTIAANVTGTAEDIVLSIRHNDTTDYAVLTVGSATQERRFYNYSLNIRVTKGDFVELKAVTPAWITNPEAWRGYGYLIISME